MPSTDDITDKIILELEKPEYRSPNLAVSQFLTTLEYCHIKYINTIPNYEDLYYLAYQIGTTCDNKEFENPAIAHFCDELRGTVEFQSIQMKAEAVENLIKSTVLDMLALEKVTDVNYLQQLLPKELISYSPLIFSLNHDIVIEKYFEERDIPFTDGFIVPVDNSINISTAARNSNLWSSETFDQIDIIKLYKIHGSVNWFRFEGDDGRDAFCKNIPMNSSRSRNSYIRQILCGSYNKFYGYHFGLFLELWTRFYLEIMKTERLIIAGYGFMDRAINNVLIKWLFKDNTKLLIINVEQPEITQKKIANSSSIWFNKWEKWIDNRKIEYITSPVEKLTKTSILDFINSA